MSENAFKNEVMAVLNEVLNKWGKIKIKRFIVEREVEFKPIFISVDLKKIINFNLISENGGLLKDIGNINESAKTVDVGYCVTVGVGDFAHEKASGLGIGYCTDMTSLKDRA